MKSTKEIATKAGIGFSIAVSVFSLIHILTVHGNDTITIKDFDLISLLLPFVFLWLDKKIAYDHLFEQYERFRESVAIQSRMAADTDGDANDPQREPDNLDGDAIQHNLDIAFANYHRLHPTVALPRWDGSAFTYATATETIQPEKKEEETEPETIKLDELIETLDKRYLTQEEASKLYQPRSAFCNVFKKRPTAQ